MAYRLKIADSIEFPVALKVRNGSAIEEHKFHLTAERLSADQAADLFRSDTERGDQTLREFLHERLQGWRGQKLVVDEADQPAAFDAQALDALLSLPGAAVVIYTDYLRELGASSGNEARRKN